MRNTLVHQHTFITGTWLVVVALLLAFGLSLMPTAAFAASVDLVGEASCSNLGGTWNTNECSVGDLTILAGDTLTILSPAILVVSGNFNNQGTLHNQWTFIRNGGTGDINNSGEIINDGSITNIGDVNNNGVIVNNALFSIFNDSVINNNNSIINNGVFYNNSTGIINNNRSGTLENNGHLFNDGVINNRGTIGGTPIENTVNGVVNELAGELIASCGNYDVFWDGTVYSAPGWNGTILVGTNSRNSLNGTDGADLILGLGGNDLIRGNGGDDVLCGGDGVDFLQGLAGNDLLDGGAGNDVLNGGSGDFDQLVAGDGNNTLLDGDGVSDAAGGSGDDLFTIVLRNGWRDAGGQLRFAGLSGGYGNDTVVLASLNRARFYIDITGDEHDDPPSNLEGKRDALGLLGVIDRTSRYAKFERTLVISAEETNVSDEAGAEYLTEPVGEDSGVPADSSNQLLLPFVNH